MKPNNGSFIFENFNSIHERGRSYGNYKSDRLLLNCDISSGGLDLIPPIVESNTL